MFRRIVQSRRALRPRSPRSPFIGYTTRGLQGVSIRKQPKNAFLLTILGLGTISTTGYLLSYTIHADSDAGLTENSEFNKLVAQYPKGEPFLCPGVQRLDVFSVATYVSQTLVLLNLLDNLNRNCICEDTMRVEYSPFSERVGYLLVGIHDGHNGPRTANILALDLGTAVLGTLADLYSMYAAKNRTVDVASGLLLNVEPGALPDPVPSDEDIDLANPQGVYRFRQLPRT